MITVALQVCHEFILSYTKGLITPVSSLEVTHSQLQIPVHAAIAFKKRVEPSKRQ